MFVYVKLTYGNAVTDAIYAYGQNRFSNKTGLAVTNGGGLVQLLLKDQPVTKVILLQFYHSVISFHKLE